MVIVFSGLLLTPLFEPEPSAFIDALRMALGVFDPREEMLGIDLELRLADLELCKLGVLGCSEMDLGNLGEPSLSQNWPW